MRKEKALTALLRGLVKIIEDEATRNPEFARKIDTLLVPLSETNRRAKHTSRSPTIPELPNIYEEWQRRGEQEFRLWLRDQPLAVMLALIKQHELDPGRRVSKWKEPEKISDHIANQLQSRLSRGSKFMRS